MNYRYVGSDCIFAKTGDIFEQSKSKKGYIHFYDENRKAYTCLPNDRVENRAAFQEIDPVEEYKDKLVDWLRDEIFCCRDEEVRSAYSNLVKHILEDL